MKTIFLAAAASLLVAAAAQAQNPPLNFDQAAYITCKEAHAMNPEARKALALYLGEHSARHHGVMIPDGPMGTQLGHLVRGGCTLAPDAYLFTVIDRAIVAEMARLPKRP
ncbi:hypothetical protein [Reyranella sp.]|uniref:hypothetical protein n=1 Tax=Reyranella sp. TaxID=1929291 RepID=UPI003BADB31B